MENCVVKLKDYLLNFLFISQINLHPNIQIITLVQRWKKLERLWRKLTDLIKEIAGDYGRGGGISGDVENKLW